MPKQPPVEITPDIIQTPLEDVMRLSMMPYAEHVILERALPRVEDGLKPVQRRILYTMQELLLAPDKPHRKCARIVGDCMGKYHPHGDSSVYDTLVRMAQDFSLRGMLVDGHGNFGSIDGDSAAAMRYTEARMAPLALEMLRDIEKDTVDFRLNFDDTLREPELLPSRFPNMLVNGASGIAVGLATNIPPHNLREACEAAVYRMKHADCALEEIMRILPAPDFPTGGMLLDTPEIKNAYATGRGKLTLRARITTEKGSAGRTLLVITEVPYQVPKAAMLKKILDLSEEKKAALSGIYDIRDESDRTGLRAVIELRKDADPERVIAMLYKYSDLQITFGVNMVAIADGKPVQMGLLQALDYYIAHQKSVVTRRTKYELEQAKARLHILEGLMKAVDCLDEVLRIIRSSQNGREAKTRLMARFLFTDIQAQAILDLRLQRLTGLEILALQKEYDEVKALVAKLESILASEKKLLSVIEGELSTIAKQYGDERRTTLVKDDHSDKLALAASQEAPVPEEATVFLTRSGALRRMHPKFYEKLDAPAAEGDAPRYLFRTQSDHTLYIFTNLGNCYTLSVGALPENNRPKDRGTLLSGVLAGLEAGEFAAGMFCLAPGAIAAMPDLLFFTKGGMVKRTQAAEYDIRRAKFAAVSLKAGDRLLAVLPDKPGADIALCTRQGMAIRFAGDSVSATGRATAGVKGVTLAPEDAVIAACLIENSDQWLLITERGYAKRLLGAMLDRQGRAGKGTRCFQFLKNGANGAYIAAAVQITSVCTVAVTQKNGQLSTLSSEEIQCQSAQDKGKPCVLALMDDVVTDAYIVIA